MHREREYLAACFHDFDGANADHAVDPDDLEDVSHRCALVAIRSRRARGERITTSALLEDLRERGDRVAEVVKAVASTDLPEDVALVAQKIRDGATARRARAKVVEASLRLERGDLAGARESAAAISAALADASDRIDPIYDFKGLVRRTTDALVDARTAGSRLIALGLPTVDRFYLASPGTLTVVGASTNVGKSSLLMTWALSMAGRGIPVGIVSVEDPAEDFGAKAVGALANVPISEAWQGRLNEDVLDRALIQTAQRALPMHFAEIKSRRIDSVLARMEQLVRGHGVRILLVDYLQAIAHRDGKDARERTERTLEELIGCAGRLDVPLVLASQLSRIGKMEQRKEPTLSDLKESGAIENRAACVVLLWRESDREGAPVLGKLAKVKRHGAGATFKLVRSSSGALHEADCEGAASSANARRSGAPLR